MIYIYVKDPNQYKTYLNSIPSFLKQMTFGTPITPIENIRLKKISNSLGLMAAMDCVGGQFLPFDLGPLQCEPTKVSTITINSN